MSKTTPFPVDAELTAIAIAYRNPDQHLIGDLVLPRLAPIGTDEYKYLQWDLAQGFTVPDLRVGRRSRPTEVEFNATEQTGSTKDYGLDDPVPQTDIDKARNAGGKVDPVKQATEYLSNLVALGREQRIANLVFDPNQYPAANKVALAGTDRFDDPASDPIEIFEQALETPIGARPNVITMGQAVWTIVRRHEKVIKFVLGSANTSGQVTREKLAEALEIDEILVGKARINTAKRGQNMVPGYVWGKHVSCFYRDRSVTSATRGMTFGFQIPRGERKAGVKPDDSIGVEGGQRVRVWESQDERIVAPDCGYLIQTAVN